MAGIQIYRELSDPSPSLVAWLEVREQLIVVKDPKGVEHSYIDNDTPRDSDITDEIVGGEGTAFPGCTLGFAIFDGDGNFVARYAKHNLKKAEIARLEARTVVPDDGAGLSWNSIDGEVGADNTGGAQDGLLAAGVIKDDE